MKEKKLKPKRRRKRDGPTPFQINLSRLIEERGLTYAGIAEITGLSQSTVFGWANGASPIQIDAIHRLSKALKVDFQWLLTGERFERDTTGLAVEDFFVEDGVVVEGVYKVKLIALSRKGEKLPRKN